MEKITISCYGDSITFGLLATSPEKSYPGILQTLFSDRCSVLNFGRSGATVIADYEPVPGRYLPYIKTEEYKSGLVSQPDIAVLMLGMNDANPTHHFNENNGGTITEAYLKLYETTLVEIIDTIKSLPTVKSLYLVKTTEMKRTVEDGFSQQYVDDFTANLVKIRDVQERVAKEKNICIIDTEEYMQNPAYYNDGCHLTDLGYEKLAETIFNRLVSDISDASCKVGQ